MRKLMAASYTAITMITMTRMTMTTPATPIPLDDFAVVSSLLGLPSAADPMSPVKPVPDVPAGQTVSMPSSPPVPMPATPTAKFTPETGGITGKHIGASGETSAEASGRTADLAAVIGTDSAPV